MDLSFYKSFIAEEIREEGRVQGFAEGFAEACAEVWAKGVLIVLEARGLDVSDGVRERVTGCYDIDLLRHWLARAITATSAVEIFGDEPAS
ncbi:hypothetical protein SAMN04487983_105930 [Streptomyces sp. yr375]|nr:hypothetical protein SAMN04487983_105930 [Streptomyces sp. yr375]